MAFSSIEKSGLILLSSIVLPMLVYVAFFVESEYIRAEGTSRMVLGRMVKCKTKRFSAFSTISFRGFVYFQALSMYSFNILFVL
jgi:hypothetical protein